MRQIQTLTVGYLRPNSHLCHSLFRSLSNFGHFSRKIETRTNLFKKIGQQEFRTPLAAIVTADNIKVPHRDKQQHHKERQRQVSDVGKNERKLGLFRIRIPSKYINCSCHCTDSENSMSISPSNPFQLQLDDCGSCFFDSTH